MLAVLLAAMVHDLGHDGCNNSFHCAANDEIAVRHAYSSPLERHHLASLFAILKEPAASHSLPPPPHCPAALPSHTHNPGPKIARTDSRERAGRQRSTSQTCNADS